MRITGIRSAPGGYFFVELDSGRTVRVERQVLNDSALLQERVHQLTNSYFTEEHEFDSPTVRATEWSRFVASMLEQPEFPRPVGPTPAPQKIFRAALVVSQPCELYGGIARSEGEKIAELTSVAGVALSELRNLLANRNYWRLDLIEESEDHYEREDTAESVSAR
jgi:hypothetical protein